MESKLYRLREFINPFDQRSLIIDTSKGLSLGALPGLEHFETAVRPALPLVDGVVVSPGQARRLTERTRQDGALLVRADWTNALRDERFVLPAETVTTLQLITPADALDLGASAIVVHLLLGYEEHIEARCIQNIVQLALTGGEINMPLIVEVQPGGSRVVLRSKAIELGVSYALEGGADGVVVPWADEGSFKTIMTMAAETPVWIKPANPKPDGPELAVALELGAAGFWLEENIFAQPQPVSAIRAFRGLVHAKLVEKA